jgi:hypothetical protein
MADPLYPEGLRWRIDPDHVAVQFFGARFGAEYMVALWAACVAVAQRAGLDGLLVHDLMRDPPLIGDEQRRFIEGVERLPMRGMRIAYVARAAADMPLYESTQILAQEREFNARVFASATEAEIWLRYASHEH